MAKLLKATAHPNELTKEVGNDYYLQTQVIGTLYTADIIERMSKKEIAITNVNGKAFVELFHKECALAVSEGYNVVTDLFHASIGIRGVIQAQSLGHNIPADQLSIRMNFIQGAIAKEAIEGISIHVAEQPAPAGPVIQNICNPLINIPDTVDSNAMVLVQGMRIAIRGKKEEIGLYFTSIDNGRVVHIPVKMFSPNTPTKLQFVLPYDVYPGAWKVKIATQSTGNTANLTENIREYEYPNIIKVV
jgi:hypothetical protein